MPAAVPAAGPGLADWLHVYKEAWEKGVQGRLAGMGVAWTRFALFRWVLVIVSDISGEQRGAWLGAKIN